MHEMSTPAKAVLMASATLMIGFSTLAACRENDLKARSRTIARGDISLAYAALAYITWPKDAFDSEESPFIFGVLGDPSATHEKLLGQYSNGKKKVHGRPVEVRKFAKVDEITGSHALLVTETPVGEEMTDALTSVRGKPVLTIGESEHFAKAGGVISVVKTGTECILELNERAARRQQLKVDARLFNVSVPASENKGFR